MTAATIFACLVTLLQPALSVPYPTINLDSHYLSMANRYGNFNRATKVITFRDGWTGVDMDRFDTVITAHEFTRYIYSIKYPYRTQDDATIKSIEEKCYD